MSSYKQNSKNPSLSPFQGVGSHSSILLIALLMSIATGLACDYFYNNSPQHTIQIAEFQTQLIQKEKKATQTIEALNQIIIHSSIDSLIHYPFEDKDISYYIFENNEMVFWSDNHLEISNTALSDSTNWHYLQLPNAHCISHLVSFDSRKILAVITIKNNYPYENDELINNFANGFKMDKQVRIVNGEKTDKQAIFSSHDNYLFSLSKPQTPIFDETWAVIGLVAYSLAFLIFFFIYAQVPQLVNKRTLSIKAFIILSASVGSIIGLMLFYNLPSLLFSNKLFTPFQYASNSLLTSIGHLSVATGYFLSTVYLFYFHVKTKKSQTITTRILMQIIFTLFFGLVYYLLSGLIYHSSIQLSILRFNDFSVITLWLHFLILLWGITLALLFFKTHSEPKTKNILKQLFITDIILSVLLYITCILLSNENAVTISLSYTALWLIFYLPFILPKQQKIISFLVWWVLIFTAFIVYNSLTLNNKKKYDKYKIIAQNISINGNSENDRMEDVLLEELEIQIKNDTKIGRLLANTDSLSAANEYLNKTYLRGFWNKYDMRLNAAKKNSDLDKEYTQYIANVGSQIKKTHFYYIPDNEKNMSFIGAFQVHLPDSDSIVFFMDFYPRRQFKSYSFPNLLITNSTDIQTKLDIAIAKYEHEKLVYSSGKTEYLDTPDWISKNQSDFYSITYNNHTHYIYKPNSGTYIVISEQQPHEWLNYLLYFIYIYLTYFTLCWLFTWTYLLIHQKRNFQLGLTTKFQYTFISLLIISFLLIFYVSVNFIQKKYQDEQISNLENKKSYIQKALQDMYYWNQDLNEQNTQALNFDLQDLSYIYHTDIHVYNNLGILIGSSQPLIFNKNLTGKRIAPTPFFSTNSNLNQYEHIGKLKYLTGYSDFYNGDYVQIGYIAIPQFLSQDEIKNEIENFLTVIIHIYLIIIILVILISLFIGKQLSAPLNILENKLKEMRLGSRNEKIEYHQNDEIGQLVMQYNRTVDELEKSAKLLAQSERESAWKSMARQVAHEINNPLTPMKLSIQQLQRTKEMNDGYFDEYFAKSTTMLIEQIDNLSRIAGTFSNFARMPEARFNRVDIAARLYSVVQLFVNNHEQVKIEYQGAKSGVFVYADPEQLVQVFNNLLKNAIQAIPDNRKGIILINLQQTEKQVIINITDNGTGIAIEAHDKLFVPNFTTKTTGMGLGLAIAKNIIELSDGTISFTTKLNEGTTFTITFPTEKS